jgi:SWI/SNF-related matrix-associated actin-dependent regulator of chromatin subfamily A member 5
LLFLSCLSSTVGSVAAAGDDKKGKKGSRGKSDRMTEAEEDEQLLKSAQSKRRVVRVDKQPSILAPHCQMHGYQLEGLNWLIKLHCNGINGILADEVSTVQYNSAVQYIQEIFYLRVSN